MKKKLHVIIAGGGIGGAATALALLNKGFDVDVYEQAPELGEVGAGVQISPNANRALDHLGVFNDLARLSSNADDKVVRLWDSGKTFEMFDLGTEALERYSYPYLTVFRPDLLQVLVDAVRLKKPDAIHLGRKCTGFAQTKDGVGLRLDDGTEVTGDVLIGADGVHSTIRAAMFGSAPAEFSGMLAWRGVVPMENLPERMNRNRATVWVGPHGHVVHYPLRGGKLMNVVATAERDDWRVESWSAQGDKEEFRADFQGWHEDIQTLIEAAPSQFKWALMVRPPLQIWAEGRTALLGDACHPTLPLLAQGAVMAIEDAVVLAKCLEKYTDDPVRALRRYEELRSPVANRKVQGANENLRRFHNEAFLQADTAADFIETEWGRAAILDRYDWIFKDDVTKIEV
ncbi:FAD-dependent monooxygenase [Antarcticimicrobium luteum]|uniref:Monooxygenase n=1 Tax=Antarcticimicrobium luteum TaxID=2547397 RepID=A0A4R5V1M7_9RHOB|nr:FAD-dependent monooxygenase [Antarcticimicrobium luteum]TDK45662.1 monooxygenase [Antarcticimicrobium luteum]